MNISKKLFLLPALTLAFAPLMGAQTTHRPPAVPLIAHDPFFSVWSMATHLTDAPTRHWSDAEQPMNGLIRIDGKLFRWMGKPRSQRDTPAMEQDSVEVTPLHSIYKFSADGVELTATFFTPLFPKDLDVLSRPVTYLSWTVRSKDGAPHKVELLLDVSPEMAVNEDSEKVTWGRAAIGDMTALSVGTRAQDLLHQSGDRIRIDWGYFRLLAPNGDGVSEEISTKAMGEFASTGKLEQMDDLDMPRAVLNSRVAAPHLDVEFALGEVTAPVDRHVLLDYDENVGIEYLGRKMRPYWQRNGMTETAMLVDAEKEYPALEARGKAFDAKLTADMTAVGGADYAYLTAMAYRQTLAAHSLVADIDGTPMLFSKENGSNGCIDTVDVTYPSSPFFLFFNPVLLQAQLEPVMRYATLPRWHFPFAPHDLGTFPLADGQVYGGGEVNEVNQMPVEESGNLLLMVAALGREQGNWDFARHYMPELTKWANYLAQNGLDPNNQLSTDDFAGHLAHNANLSIKAIEALGAFVQIAHGVGDDALATKYQKIVAPMPAEWMKLDSEGDHYKLAFDASGTWSQKYNLAWDRVLDMHLFPASVADTEWAFYRKHMEPYGLPLDSRKTYTKLDWEVWTSTLSNNPQDSKELMHRIALWLDATPSRVPMTDWYDTISGKMMAFQARSVVGGVYIKALLDPQIAAHWKVTAH